VDLNKYLSTGFKVQKLFVDPTGNHILVSAVHKDREKDMEDLTAELFYLHSSSVKPRQVRYFSKFVFIGFKNLPIVYFIGGEKQREFSDGSWLEQPTRESIYKPHFVGYV